jgi:hypothetical protein
VVKVQSHNIKLSASMAVVSPRAARFIRKGAKTHYCLGGVVEIVMATGSCVEQYF